MSHTIKKRSPIVIVFASSTFQPFRILSTLSLPGNLLGSECCSSDGFSMLFIIAGFSDTLLPVSKRSRSLLVSGSAQFSSVRLKTFLSNLYRLIPFFPIPFKYWTDPNKSTLELFKPRRFSYEFKLRLLLVRYSPRLTIGKAILHPSGGATRNRRVSFTSLAMRVSTVVHCSNLRMPISVDISKFLLYTHLCSNKHIR